MHVSSVVFWIIFAAISSVLTYLKQYTGKNIFSPLLLKVQFAIFIISVLAILMSYCLGIFGGREYWEFHPLLALPIVIGWILFIFNFIKSVGSLNNLPVYVDVANRIILFSLHFYGIISVDIPIFQEQHRK
ncbi:MAG: hypothetical protein IPN55_14040 [Saprospiraceae bacterium]|nr:hypothetical protein [Candidatus Brachybacter algidus]